jgi:LacI family transcriptional regulator
MIAAGLTPLVAEAPADEEGARVAAEALLAGDDRPTAMVCATDRMAFGVLRAARQRGLSVPGDLSVIGHDNLPGGAYSDPPLSTMELAIAETGRTLADMLLARIAGAPADGLQTILPVRAIARGSVAPPRQRHPAGASGAPRRDTTGRH